MFEFHFLRVHVDVDDGQELPEEEVVGDHMDNEMDNHMVHTDDKDYERMQHVLQQIKNDE